MAATPGHSAQAWCASGCGRHVERKVYKMRELRVGGIVKLKLVPTKDMDADILTKAVDDATFARHRATILNESAVVPGTSMVFKTKTDERESTKEKDRVVANGA